MLKRRHRDQHRCNGHKHRPHTVNPVPQYDRHRPICNRPQRCLAAPCRHRPTALLSRNVRTLQEASESASHSKVIASNLIVRAQSPDMVQSLPRGSYPSSIQQIDYRTGPAGPTRSRSLAATTVTSRTRLVSHCGSRNTKQSVSAKKTSSWKTETSSSSDRETTNSSTQEVCSAAANTRYRATGISTFLKRSQSPNRTTTPAARQATPR